jgi:sugar (pentulose or hexulose) kinase
MAGEFGVEEDFYRQDQLTEALQNKYVAFMRQLVEKQVASTRLAIGHSPIQRIFVDGGFSKNETYMNLLAESFPKIEVIAAEVSQATAMGAAMAIHSDWNEKPLSKNLISLKKIRVLSVSSYVCPCYRKCFFLMLRSRERKKTDVLLGP